MEMERAGLIPKGAVMEDFMAMRPKEDEIDGPKGTETSFEKEASNY